MKSDRVKSLGKFQLVFADAKGEAFSYPGLRPAGMKAGAYFPLEEAPALRLPDASELFFLPDRLPVGFDSVTGESTVLESDPYSTHAEPCFAVAAFIPPGYTLTHNAAYAQKPGVRALPLFAYGACYFANGHFYVSAVCVDRDVRHEERLLSPTGVSRGPETGTFGNGTSTRASWRRISSSEEWVLQPEAGAS